MNTLPKAITARFFQEPAHYDQLKVCWKTLLNSRQRHNLTAAHHLLYLVLRGKNWRKAFTPITNVRKLANGASVNGGLYGALWGLHGRQAEAALLAPFGSLVTPAMLQLVRELVPHRMPSTAYAYPPELLIPANSEQGKVNA